MLSELGHWVTASLSNGIPRRSLAVAVVVGSVLNLINQGDALIGSGSVTLWKVAFTYLVPYLVATYGAVSATFDSSRTKRT